MCEAIGRDVGELQRIKFGPLELGRLKEGTARKLSARGGRIALAECRSPDANKPSKQSKPKSRGNSRTGTGKTR